MKKTQFIDALKNIRKRLASFLSIALVIAIGVGGFFTTQNLYLSMDETFGQLYLRQNFKDLDLISSGGIVDDDVITISHLDEVEDTEAVIRLDGKLTSSTGNYNITIISLTQKISVPELIEGRFPESMNEIALNQDLAEAAGISINDKIEITSTSELYGDPLKEDYFYVCGIVRHPEYVRKAMTWVAVLPMTSFNLAATNNAYTNLFVTLKDSSYDQLSSLIPKLSERTTLRIRENADEIVALRAQGILDELKEAQSTINREEREANDRLQEAEDQIREFEDIFAGGQRQIDEGKAQLENAWARLQEAEQQIADGEKQLADARKAYDSINKIIKAIRDKTGQNITPEMMLELIDDLKDAIEAFKEAAQGGQEDMIIMTVDMLISLLDDDVIYEMIDKISDVEELFDPETLIAMIEEKRGYVDEILNERSEDALTFLDYFTEEGLEKYTDILMEHFDELADALKNGSAEQIEQAKQKIRDLFDEKGSIILDRMMQKYTGYSLEEIFEKLQNVQMLEQYEEKLDQIITMINEDPLFRYMFTKQALNGLIDSLIDLADEYSRALISDNQEQIAAAKQAINDFLDKQSTKDAIELIELITGEDINGYISLIRIGSQLIEFIDFAEIIKAKIDVDYPDFLTPESVTTVLQKAKQFIHQAVALSEHFSEENYDNLMTLLDVLVDDETFYFIMQMVKYKYGFDFWGIIEGIQDGTYVEIVRFFAHLYIDKLKNNADLINEFGKAAIEQALSTYNQKLDQLEEQIRNRDLRAAFEIFKSIISILSSNDFSLLKDLIVDYLNKNISIDLTRFITADRLDMLSDKLDDLKKAVNAYGDLGRQIADGERKLEQGRNELAAGYDQYYSAKALLEEKEKLLNSSAEEIRQARSQLEDKRQEAINAIEDARNELEAAQLEADEAIAKGKEELLKRNYSWVITDRNTNESYMDVQGATNGARGSNKAFGTLFLLVIALVCFSSIAIIVEEEKKSVGTTKAFGFYNREILGKYLVFGLGAAIIGCILGLIVGLVICNIIMGLSSDAQLYLLDAYIIKTSPLYMVLVPLFVMALTALTVFLACADLLKSPAALLMKGETVSSRDRKNKKRKTPSRSDRSLYSRLILRNIINEKERVAITVIIMAISCFCTGTGVTLRDAFTGMIEKQKEEIYLYDFRINHANDVSDIQLQKIESILNANDTDYIKAFSGSTLYDGQENAQGIQIIAADDDLLRNFIAIKDPQSGEDIPLPDDGVLAQLRLAESYGYEPGTSLVLYDDQLERYTADVKGIFQNYQGRLILSSREAYKKIFGKEAKDNCYFVRMNKDNYDEISNQLADLSYVTIERADSYMNRLRSATTLFNIILFLMVLMSVLMSFMILTNLANIFLARKKKELTIMRINGFSIKETISYLAKETILTSLLGVILAVIMGITLERFPIRILEQPDAQFVRSFDTRAWVFAVGLELLFAFIINYLVFRKVKKLNFRDVQ